MPATKVPREHSTLMVEEFPVRLRLRVKAKALLEQRRMRDVFVELLEKALAAEEANAGERRKP